MDRLFVATLANFYGYTGSQNPPKIKFGSKTRLQVTLEKLSKLSNPQKDERSVSTSIHSHCGDKKSV